MIGWFLLTPLALVTIMFAIEILLGLKPLRGRPAAAGAVRIAIIVPAHDEAQGIAATLRTLVVSDKDIRTLVIADNCSDDSGSIARASGAEVIERKDAARRGKGYALAYARDHLAADPPEVVVVIDADCETDIAAIVALSARACASGQPVQAAYLMRPCLDRGAMVALSGFAFLVKNLVRQRGLARLGAPAILTGSGMAFPWPIFASAPLATDDPVEDLALGIALSRGGNPPAFADDTIVWTRAASQSATRDQRDRWERGFLATAWGKAPGLIGTLRPSLICSGADLFVPPLALLAMLHLMLVAGLLIFAGSTAILAAEAMLLGAMLLAVALAWAVLGRPWLKGGMLLAIPFYVAWKLPIYAAVLLRRSRGWNRTKRD